MKRYDVIRDILSGLDQEDLALFTTGMISREAFSINDRDENFYMIGSMGLISSFALGIALNTKKRVVIFDGDGSALMEMGTMAMIAHCRPKNLVHIVLDNESYQSTGGQPTLSKKISLENIAKASGYAQTVKITTPGQLKRVSAYLRRNGPLFILIKVDKSGIKTIGRVTLKLEQIKDRYMKILRGNR